MAEEKPTTIQLPSKKWKVHQLICAFLMIFGILWAIVGVNYPQTTIGNLGFALMIVLGLIWFIVARVLASWHHG